MPGGKGAKQWAPSPALRRTRRICWAVLLPLGAAGVLLWRAQSEPSQGGSADGSVAFLAGGSRSNSSGERGDSDEELQTSDSASTINLEALDGTGGRQGPRRWDDGGAHQDAEPYPDPKSYLDPKEFLMYQRWLKWSDKPRGLDHVQPSKTYFSLGKTRRWVGDINRPGAMQKMLEARSYKHEIIQACITGGDVWRIGLNFIFNMRDLGYDHWVILVPRLQQCNELEAALRGVGSIGCMWTTMFDDDDAPRDLRQFPERPPAKQVTWVLRWVTLLRAVRLGFNMLNIDTDVALHDDIYKYLKGPLLGNLTWVCGDEDSGDGCNGGTNYVQNANPNGAAAWMAGTMVDRMLRLVENTSCWRDNPFAKGIDWADAVDDQAQLGSAMRSATIGHYVMPHVFEGMDDEVYWKLVAENPWTVFDKQYNRDESLQTPKLWKPRFGVDRVGVRWHKLEVPTKQLTPIFNNSRGAFTEKFWAEVAEESGPITWHDVTLGPQQDAQQAVDAPQVGAAPKPADPWDGFTAAGSSSDSASSSGDASGEYIGKAMDFVINNWHSGFECGRWWGLKPPRSVISHTVLIPGAFARTMFLKITGWFHWKVEDIMVQHLAAPGFYPVSTPGSPLPKLLLVAPSANLDNVTSAFLDEIGFDLLTAAELAGRKLVWPLIGCATQWLVHSEKPADHGPHSDLRGCHLPRGCTCGVKDHWFGTPWHSVPAVPVVDDNYPLERKYCIHWRWFEDCWRHTLMYPDYKHVLRHFPAFAAIASPKNTLFFSDLVMRAEIGVEDMSAEALERKLRALDAEPVVYLGRVPRITDGVFPEERRGELEQLQHACRPVWQLSGERLLERLAPLLGRNESSETRR